MIAPAVEGTLSIMRACSQNSHQVKRCVITASINSIIYPTERPAGMFNESHWSDQFNPKLSAYAKSKLLAEKAAWDFHSQLPEGKSFELVTILPGKICGPSIRKETAVSINFVRDFLTGEMPAIEYR